MRSHTLIHLLYLGFCFCATTVTSFKKSSAPIHGIDMGQQQKSEDRLRLVKLPPVEVGYVRQMELKPGTFYDVKTVAMNPEMFLIPDFLSSEECDRLKSLATKNGLIKSQTLYGVEDDVDDNGNNTSSYSKETLKQFDQDKNNVLNVTEAFRALSEIEGVLSLSLTSFKYLFDEILDLNSDRELDKLEIQKLPKVTNRVKKWIKRHQMGIAEPYEVKRRRMGPSRISRQAWLTRDVYDKDRQLTNRLIALTRLHPDVVSTSEPMQVVFYTPGGHYHAHHDSSELDFLNLPCEHTRSLYNHTHPMAQRLCRFITILYYLDDTKEGGETAFPVADNATYTMKDYQKNNKSINPFDLANYCKDANLIVQPRKGLAVMWYNHHINNNTGMLGDHNPFSLHGGCDVLKGEKWIANNWITVDDNHDMQMKFHHKKLYGDRKGKSPSRDHVADGDDETDNFEADKDTRNEL